MNFEYEAKALISFEDYTKLISSYEIIETINQTNIYFETADDWFKHNKSALRVRTIEGKPAVLTLKQKIKDGNIEHDFPLSSEEKSLLINQFTLPETELPFTDIILSKQFKMGTIRSKFLYNGLTIEIDQTDFNGIIDYEIEIEAPNIKIANEAIKQLAQENNISLHPSAPKIARYFLYNKEHTE